MAKPEHDSDSKVVNAIEHLENALRRAAKKLIAAIVNKNKKKSFHGIIVIHPLEPIHRKPKVMDPINLGQIPLGMRLPVDILPDEPVDVKPDGNFASLTVTDGDSTAFVAPGGTSKGSRFYFNGDGAVGVKGADGAVDGHVGPDDVEIVQHYTWEVISPDATTFTSTPGKLEPIPTP